ncbi:Membrane protein involved in the export of O-antigen, teichoic acid lipoteichoic acid [Arcticibacter svalbardensis MN12-7]|uniref:Membrane protein involved in the export of O-antigen, teichoic acid lipoteichoic acid n=1 Tax=Arcticibacter svalbardensis MN12-7 TaxID=1150600 RepID=R9H006_9SPHI|nr:hypothetical protein [Arcticibacter svalbardensis]EOR94564.1 Membrane protein involved in the export of O-antigen, teichoic acid lipoteichoic acid [Arcticibacter svalbardensis MN12-7]
MGAANRVVKNTGILYAKMGITVFMSLYTTRLILGSLGVADFGIFSLIGGAIAMLTFLNTAMAATTQRFMSFAEGVGDKLKQQSIFNVSVILHICIAVLVLIILEVVGYFLFKGVFKIPLDRLYSAKVIYQFMIVSTLFTIVSVPYDAVINAHENMWLYSIIGILESVLKLGTAFYVVKTSYDKLIVYGLLTAILTVILLIVRRIYCKRKYAECEINFKVYFDKSIFKDLTKFAAWAFLGSSTSILAFYGQGIVLNSFFGTAINTTQGITNQVSGQLSAFAGTMLKALNPVIGKSEGAGDRSLMLRASMMGSKISFFLLMFFFIPVMLETPYIFHLWLKDVPAYTVIFCRLLLIKNLIDQLFITLATSISATGKIKKFQIYSSILYCFPLVVSIIFFKMGYPPYTLYVIFIIHATISSCVTLHFAKVNCDLSISYFLKSVVLRCVGSYLLVLLLSAIPLFIIPDPSILRLLLVVSLSSVLFLLAIWFIGFTTEERLGVSNFLHLLLGKILPKKSVSVSEV